MAKLADLLAERGAISDEMKALPESDDFTQKKFDALETRFKAVNDNIRAVERSREVQAQLAQASDGSDVRGAEKLASPVPLPARDQRRGWDADDYLSFARQRTGFRPQPDKHFKTLGEQLLAVAKYYLPEHRHMDARLVRAPTGGSEMDPSTGGFLVQTDFSTAIFQRAYDLGEILSRVQKLTISSNANGIKIPGVDETSRATGSRWGGVQSYWVAEGTSVTASKPKFRLIELDLKKMMSVMYVTDELLADASILSSIATQAFSEEIVFMTEDAIWEGTGAGMPLGILLANATVSVAKETGQASATLTYTNILAMWSRMWARSRQNAVWFINQDVEPQLYSLSQVIGVSGVPVYLPANGISGAAYGTLFGRPVIPIEYGSTLGTAGDIVLADMSQYVLADKGGVDSQSSMHVAFLTDEMVFRITYRVDGQPLWNSALTPFKGSSTKSPFITLAAR
jgi:HK97 family phage major capsid protein